MVTSAGLLLQEDNWALLQKLQLDLNEDEKSSVAWERLGSQLRAEGMEPALATALTAQLALREEAKAKFGDSAAHMLFTRDGLEQATRFPVSFLHAAKFLAAGISTVADLGCGIGADAVAMATAGLKVVALDKDPAATACAAANLRPFPDSEVMLGDIADVNPGWLAQKGVTGIFLDPARRSDGKRILDPNGWSPPWTRVEEIFSWGFPTGIKLAPGIDYSYLSAGHAAEWVSVDGQLVEASLWSAQLSGASGGRSAVLVQNERAHTLSDPDVTSADGPEPSAPVGPLGEYLFEPDPAVIRSGNLAYLASTTGTHLLSPRIAYLSGAAPADSPFLTSFKVESVVPLRAKQVQKELQSLGAGSVEVKKRGADLDPNAWQRDLQKKLAGPPKKSYVVFATRVKDSHRAIIGTRIGTSPGN